MNIFILERNENGGVDWKQSAISLDNYRVVKMTLEVAQLLSTAVHALGDEAPYKPCHKNHPCSVWTRSSRMNFFHLVEHGLAMANEYTGRFGKHHKSSDVIRYCYDKAFMLPFPQEDETPPALAVGDASRFSGDVVDIYRQFYALKPRMRYPRSKIPVWFPGLRGDIPFEIVED